MSVCPSAVDLPVEPPDVGMAEELDPQAARSVPANTTTTKILIRIINGLFIFRVPPYSN
jgi:hypothetical protein